MGNYVCFCLCRRPRFPNKASAESRLPKPHSYEDEEEENDVDAFGAADPDKDQAEAKSGEDDEEDDDGREKDGGILACLPSRKFRHIYYLLTSLKHV